MLVRHLCVLYVSFWCLELCIFLIVCCMNLGLNWEGALKDLIISHFYLTENVRNDTEICATDKVFDELWPVDAYLFDSLVDVHLQVELQTFQYQTHGSQDPTLAGPVPEDRSEGAMQTAIPLTPSWHNISWSCPSKLAQFNVLQKTCRLRELLCKLVR